MTNTPDMTAPEAVERLIVWLMDAHETGNTEKNPEVWRTLEALSAALHDVRSEYDDFRQRKERPMADQDTDLAAPEQVERLAKTCEGASAIAGRRRLKAQHAHHKNCADTLRALSAERDEWKAAAQRHHPNPADFRYWEGRYRGEKARAEAAEAELTTLKAELAEAVAVMQRLLNFVANTENEVGITLDSADTARAFLARHQKDTDT